MSKRTNYVEAHGEVKRINTAKNGSGIFVALKAGPWINCTIWKTLRDATGGDVDNPAFKAAQKFKEGDMVTVAGSLRWRKQENPEYEGTYLQVTEASLQGS